MARWWEKPKAREARRSVWLDAFVDSRDGYPSVGVARRHALALCKTGRTPDGDDLRTPRPAVVLVEQENGAWRRAVAFKCRPVGYKMSPDEQRWWKRWRIGRAGR